MENRGFCVSCKHAPGFISNDTAECRRHAPLPRIVAKDQLLGDDDRTVEWPVITKNDFCGEWEAED